MSKKILLAVNSRISLRQHCRALAERTSYEVMATENGQDAIEKAISEQPDLIIMTTALIKKNGLEACAEIRRNPETATVPIILLSSHADQELMNAGFRSGCSDFLVTPLSEQVLVNLAQEYLD